MREAENGYVWVSHRTGDMIAYTFTVSMEAEVMEGWISEWRSYLGRHRTEQTPGVETLEGRLREEAAALQHAGLDSSEAFLVAVRRIGLQDATTLEFGRARSERLWEQPEGRDGADYADEGSFLGRALTVLAPGDGKAARSEPVMVLGLAVAAALLVKAPRLFGVDISGPSDDTEFYARNLSLFVLPLLAGYFFWKRGVDPGRALWLAMAFAGAAVFANIFRFEPGGSTLLLTALHLPIALWLAVGAAYTGGRWRSSGARMEFVRFSGELFIYYVLIALGGGVFMALTVITFSSVGVGVEALFTEWVMPCGAMGAVIIAAWLVEQRRGIVGDIAPMLARVFTPLFAVMLLALLVAMVWTGGWADMDREMLIGFDLLLALVLGLLLYTVAARNPLAKPNVFDGLALLLVVAALAVDVLALGAIAARITEFGFTPNRTAALGENLVLLCNLGGSAGLYGRFLSGHAPFALLERWQTGYLPVYGLWAGVVVVAFPPLFGYA